jgi:predicted permease
VGSLLRELTDQVRLDLTYAGRTILRSPSFVVAVVALSVAVGLTTAVRGTADWLLRRPPGGVQDPDRLVTFFQSYLDPEYPGRFGISRAQYDELKRVQDGFTEVSAYSKVPGVVSTDFNAEQAVLEFVTSDYFSVLGLRPALGRLIAPEDDVEGAPIVAVLTHRFWQSFFGGDLAVLDRTVRVNGVDVRVVGVLPEEFEGYSLDWNGPTSVVLPMDSGPALGGRNFLFNGTTLRVIGRLAPGIPVEAIPSRADVWLERLPPIPETQLTAFGPTRLNAIPSNRFRLGYDEGAVGRYFVGLIVVCLLVLFAASFNLANVFLGHGVARRREMAMRAAIGASVGRLARQVATEVLLVWVAAVALAAPCAIGAAWLLAPLPGAYLEFAYLVTPLTTAGAADAQMLVAALGLSSLCVVGFGLLPALAGARESPLAVLRNPDGRWTWSGFRITPRQVVLLLQVGLSVTIGIVAGLYARSFAQIADVPEEYAESASLLVARVQRPGQMAAADVEIFYRELTERAGTLPQVVSVAIRSNPPFVIGSNLYGLPQDVTRQTEAATEVVTPRFFETHGVQIVGGREFSELEPEGSVVINQVLAATLWPAGDPVGRTITYGRGEDTSEGQVIGVVAQERCTSPLGDPEPCAWVPLRTSLAGYLSLRTTGDPMALVPDIRAIVRDLSPDAVVSVPTTMDLYLGRLTAAERVSAGASAGLAGFALILVTLGSSSLFLSMVRASLREIAIRMALGASAKTVAARVVGQGLALTVVGIVGGVFAARRLSDVVESQLFQVDAHDPLTYVVVPVLIAAATILSVGYAALVATKTQPMRHLRAN